jgi:hypothetical protein
MNDSTGVLRRSRRARPPAARAAATIIATTALARVAAACSGSPSATGTGGSADAAGSTNAGGATGSPSAVAYSQCMRSHGVPNFPDPGSDGQPPKTSAQDLGISNSQYQVAQRACQHLLPIGGAFQQQASQCILAGDCPPTLVQQMMTTDRKFAQCMRSHGVPSWPDPTIGSEGRPVFDLTQVGITHRQTHSPPMSYKITECQALAPATLTFGLREGP